MTHLYGARKSFYVLRPKNTIKLLTQSAEKGICLYGKTGTRKLGDFFSKTGSLQLKTTRPFLSECVC